MKTYTSIELIANGFTPSAARAKMSIPFRPNLGCSSDQYKRLPKDIKNLYRKESNDFYTLIK
jgi:hypothetical protein